MKASTIVLIYFAILGICIYYSNLVLTSLVIILGVVYLITIKIIENSKIKNIKQIVTSINSRKKVNYTPFVNVNKEGWKVLQELPNVNRVLAKKIVYIRKHHGKYSSLDDFFTKNLINDEEEKNILKKIIYI